MMISIGKFRRATRHAGVKLAPLLLAPLFLADAPPAAGGTATPLRPATVTWGGVSNNEQFATPAAQTGWEFTARHMDAMFLHGAYWVNHQDAEWEAACRGLGQVLVRHGKTAHVETGFGEGRRFDPTDREKREPYRLAVKHAKRIREMKERFGIGIVKVRADWFPMFAMAAYANHYQLRDDNLKFLAMVTGADGVFGPYPPGFTAGTGHWREYAATLDRELPGMPIAFDQAPCNHRPLSVPEVRAKVPWPGLGYGYTRKVAMLNEAPVEVGGRPVEVKFDFADQLMGAVIASRSAKVNFVGFEGDTPYSYITDGPPDFPRQKLVDYLLSIERLVHAQGLKNGRIINDCGKAYGDADKSWIQVDLGKVEELDRIRIVWGDDLPTNGIIRTGIDAREFSVWSPTTRPERSAAAVDYGQKKPRQARFIRWDGRKRASPRGYQICALEAYGPARPEVDQARGKPVRASSTNHRICGADGKPLHMPGAITDGDAKTYWENHFIDNDGWDKLYHDRTLEYLEFYQSVGGRADEYIAESWYSGPFTFFPETKPGTFTNLARNLIRRIKGIADDGSLMPLDLAARPENGGWLGESLRQPRAEGVQIIKLKPGSDGRAVLDLRIRNLAKELNRGDARATPLLRAGTAGMAGWTVKATTPEGTDVTDQLFARNGSDGWFVGGLEPGQDRTLRLSFSPREKGQTGAMRVSLDLYWNPQETSPKVRDSMMLSLGG